MSSTPSGRRLPAWAIGFVLVAGLVVACTSTRQQASQEEERASALRVAFDAEIGRDIIAGSRAYGERIGPRYAWTIEGLPECPEGGMFEYGSASVVSGSNPVVRSMLWVAQGPDGHDRARAEFLKQAKDGLIEEWLGPWQTALCNSLNLRIFIDPIGAGMEDRGGEGLALCEFSPSLLCVMEYGRRSDQFTPTYGSTHIKQLLVDEVDQQRQFFSAHRVRATEAIELVMQYENLFDVSVSIAPVTKRMPTLFRMVEVNVGPPIPKISIAAVFARAVYVRAAASAWEGLRVSLHAHDSPEAAFAKISASAEKLRSDFRREFRFILAHELAHLYLGDGESPNPDEILVDCAAVLQLGLQGAAIEAGAVDLIERAYRERVESHFGLAPQDREKFDSRREAFRHTLNDIKGAGVAGLPFDYCEKVRAPGGLGVSGSVGP